MNNFSQELNEFLVETFNNILKEEQQIIQHDNNIPLTISELHLIGSIGNSTENNTISDIAGDLGITLSSVTIAVNKLIKKGFVVKSKDVNDKRSVRITLSETGLKMHEYHLHFHDKMIEKIEEDLSEEEKVILISGVRKLTQFFNKNI